MLREQERRSRCQDHAADDAEHDDELERLDGLDDQSRHAGPGQVHGSRGLWRTSDVRGDHQHVTWLWRTSDHWYIADIRSIVWQQYRSGFLEHAAHSYGGADFCDDRHHERLGQLTRHYDQWLYWRRLLEQHPGFG
jgi:hypothetical protein